MDFDFYIFSSLIRCRPNESDLIVFLVCEAIFYLWTRVDIAWCGYWKKEIRVSEFFNERKWKIDEDSVKVHYLVTRTPSPQWKYEKIRRVFHIQNTKNIIYLKVIDWHICVASWWKLASIILKYLFVILIKLFIYLFIVTHNSIHTKHFIVNTFGFGTSNHLPTSFIFVFVLLKIFWVFFFKKST